MQEDGKSQEKTSKDLKREGVLSEGDNSSDNNSQSSSDDEAQPMEDLMVQEESFDEEEAMMGLKPIGVQYQGSIVEGKD